MGWHLPLITLLVVTVIRWHVVSATDCRESNCQFAVREECQNSQTVSCSMKHRPMKTINITASSFPRDVRDIEISDAEMITFEPNSIFSLTSLEDIKITNVSTLILLPRSLARGNEFERISVTASKVMTLQIHPETLAGWRGGSKINIDSVHDCQMLQYSISSAQFRSLSLKNIQSLVVQENAFSNDCLIENLHIKDITSLSFETNALASNVVVNKTWIEDIQNLTIHSDAFSRKSTIHEARLKRVAYLTIESDGIQADIGEVKVTEVEMETCGENAFGGNIGSLSLSSSHIHRTVKNCVSAGNGMEKLMIENSHFNQIDTSGICGTVTEVHIKNGTIGKIAKAGLQLNVTKFSIENSTIGEAREKAFVVVAEKDITIMNCTIDVLQKDVLSSLRVKEVYSTAHPRIQLKNLLIKHPQNGSLKVDQDQRITVHEIETDIPCNCDIESTLGLDMSSEHTFWINQPLCVIKDTRPTLGHYLKEFCTEPTTIPPSTIPDEVNDTNPRPGTLDRVIRNKPSGDGSDQVRTGSIHNMALIATITVAVLIVLAFLTLFLVRRRFRRKSRQCADKGQPSPDTTLHPQSNQQTHETDSSPEISGPINSYVPDPFHSTPYPTIIAETAETHKYGEKPNKTWAGVCRESQTVHSPMAADGVHESNCDMTHGTGNVTGDTVHQEMTDLLDSPSSPVSAWTHTSCGPQQDGSWQNVYLAPLDAKMRANEAVAQHLGNNRDSGYFTITSSTTVSHDELSQPLNEWYNAPEWLADGPRHYIDIPIYYTAPRRVPERRRTETRLRCQDEVIHQPDERYKLSASYRSDRPKDPRIQQLARDPRWARRYEKESEL